MVRGKKENGLGHVLRLAVASKRVEGVEGREHLLHLLVGHEGIVDWGLHDGRRDRVDADPIGRKFEREIATMAWTPALAAE